MTVPTGKGLRGNGSHGTERNLLVTIYRGLQKVHGKRNEKVGLFGHKKYSKFTQGFVITLLLFVLCV